MKSQTLVFSLPSFAMTSGHSFTHWPPRDHLPGEVKMSEWHGQVLGRGSLGLAVRVPWCVCGGGG